MRSMKKIEYLEESVEVQVERASLVRFHLIFILSQKMCHLVTNALCHAF
jgi:hypothetical protein